jgi:hypothetical protein
MELNEITLKEFYVFSEEIIPEYLEILKKILAKNKTLSKIQVFRNLFEYGEKKYKGNNFFNTEEFRDIFTSLLTKSNMEYSGYLAYVAGCIKGKYGNTYSRCNFLGLINQAAKVGKKHFFNNQSK